MKHSKGERSRPGAAARYFYAERLTAGRQPAPAFVPGSLAPELLWRMPQNRFTVQCGGPGWETNWVYAVEAWGNLCRAKLPL